LKRVLVIGMNYSPEITGIGKYTGEFCEYLNSRNHDVQVVTGYPYYPQWKSQAGYNTKWYKRESVSGVRILRCPFFIANPKKKYQRVFQELSFFISSFLAVTLFCFKKNKANFLFVISPSMLSGLVGLWYKLWCPSVKMIYHIQDIQVDAASRLGIIRQKRLLFLFGKVEKFIIEKADVVSAISTGMLKKIANKSFKIKKIVLFPNWVNTQEIYPTEVSINFLSQNNLNKGKRIILYSGAIGEKQGLDIVIQAARHLEDELQDIIFIVCGSGPYFDTLRDQCFETKISNIEFRPLLPINEYNQLLNAAWLHLVIQKETAEDLVMPSKLNAIMATGGMTIVTANTNTDLYNLIHENNLGYIIKPENPVSLSEAIRHLSLQPELIELKKNAALRYSKIYLSREIVINKFLESIFENSYYRNELIHKINNQYSNA